MSKIPSFMFFKSLYPLMDKTISFCGTICSDCEYYQNECKGCSGVDGRPFWIQYVEQDTCKIYDCCANKKKVAHCGKCNELPCDYYFDTVDPNITEEQRRECLKKQIEMLKSL